MTDLPEIENLISDLKKLPNITTKQAEKITYYLLNANEMEVRELVEHIENLKDRVRFCSQCNNISLTPKCSICSNPSRNQKQLCIVSSPNDVSKIENTNSYTGLYFVLHHEVNIKTKSNLKPEIVKKLTTLLSDKNPNEIIIATNWTPNGEATAYFLKQVINQMFPNIHLYRLAVGLPINSSLSYADTETLTHAIKNKIKYE